MSTHRRSPLAGPLRRPRARPLVTAAAGATAVFGMTILTATVTRGDTSQNFCEQNPRRLTVAVAPTIYPLVEEAAPALVPEGSAGCVLHVFSSADPSKVAAALAASPSNTPDVWIPDSSARRPTGVEPGPSLTRSVTVPTRGKIGDKNRASLVPVYLPGAIGLDYPWLVLAPDPTARRDAAALLRRLQTYRFQAALAAQGFRPARADSRLPGAV